MSMCALGMAEEFRDIGIGVNTLWPRAMIKTAAADMLVGGDSGEFSRKDTIMADAAYLILTSDPKTTTGNFFIDDELLAKAGITDFSEYSCVKGNEANLMVDLFLGPGPNKHLKPNIDENHTSGGKKGQVEGLFDKIASLLNEDIVKRTNAIYQFDVKGDEAGLWFADLKNGAGKVGKGEPPTPADATLTMDGKNFFEMFAGRLKPTSAFMTGKLKIKGDLKKAMALEKLMGNLKSKL